MEQILAEMPAFPIYCEASRRYVIYDEGHPLVFPTESSARIGRIAARERWMRARGLLSTPEAVTCHCTMNG